jgi:signal transduction histidine kinase
MVVLDEITAGIQEVAKGELSHRIEVRTSDEFGVVAASINQMAEQLQRSLEEERSAVKAKNDLITGISHDLRTPLTSILGFLEYIEKDRYQDELEMRYYVSIAYEKSLTLRKLIDDLFEYTRVSGGSLPLSLRPLNLTPFLMQLAEEFAPMLEEAGMTYTIVGGQEPLWVQAAPGELVRAYENLFSNAIRYGAQGKLMEIGLTLEDGEAVVRISNYGEPIPANDLPHLFERFYRVDKSRSRDTGGTGLGLAIAKSMIELHRGQIAAYSEQGRTDFVTRFPAIPPPVHTTLEE